MNSVAGGGSFLSFPSLVFAGVPPISANATNNGAMWVGTIGSARGYKEEIAAASRALAAGHRRERRRVADRRRVRCCSRRRPLFERLIPWLLLFATAVFAVSPWLVRRHGRRARTTRRGRSIVQFFVAIYGGYFGAGMGILMLAVLAFSGLPILQRAERDQERALGDDQRRRPDAVRFGAHRRLALRHPDGGDRAWPAAISAPVSSAACRNHIRASSSSPSASR